MVYKKMVGLSIVLESTSSPQIIISKVSIPSPSVSSSHYAPTSRTATSFLDVCSLCKKNLSPGEDIYMYKGDGAFCSVECRSRQICMDEENVFREKNCSLIASFIAGSASRRLNSGDR